MKSWNIISKLSYANIMVNHMKCTVCSANIIPGENYVEFVCPKCGEEKVIRCKKCKLTANEYTCKKCGFVGP